ncbi:MAG: 3-dehydroquinate synthase, partial [Methylobacillus glycogenes]|nr:3-dehydroquinate synthase [Methylobacillus glycogenes]
MQESFEINSASGSYEIVVGSGLLNDIVQAHPDAIFLVDERLKGCLPVDRGLKIILLQAVENNKSLEAMPEVILKMREAGANRGTHLVAIGGGIIQDIATFVASIYMRGLAWTYMPTTFLGMVDSCIGGKSSVNVHNYKNLVGNFHPPKSVHIDLDFLKTLSAEMVVGGLYEAAKICYARSYEKFGEYLAEQPQYPLSSEQAHNIILHSLKTKKWFIEIDEFDQKERLLLNYGHTFGHAIEAGTNFGISHGIAVGIGMVVAVEYAKANGQLTAAGQQSA